jgi:polyferredoxin
VRTSNYRAGTRDYGASAAAFAIVFAVCAFPQAIMSNPVPMLLERFLPGGGWVEIFGLSLYGAWLVDKLLHAQAIAPVRKTVWLLFSIVFFGQLLIGLAGVRQCLMTGTLHVPVPAVILAGPIFRGDGFFMLILFGATLLVAGPAWCSWLCYIGGWDNLAASHQPQPGTPGRQRELTRVIILAGVIVSAVLLRRAGVSGIIAATGAGIFGILGVGIIAFWSRKHGTMVHCTMFCPMGLIAAVAGKINPFRMKIRKGCTECRSCANVCRYGALEIENIRARKPGLTCTLCGDCASVCSGGFIDYRLFGLQGLAARKVFLVLVVALHAVFLGFARI